MQLSPSPPQPFLIPVEDRYSYVQLRWLEGNSDFSEDFFFRGKRRERIEIMNEQSKENRKRVR